MSEQSFPRVSIARRTLIYDWRRYAAAVAALGLSGLLMLAQIGLLFGQFATFTVTLRQSNADLIVTSGDSLSFDASVDILNVMLAASGLIQRLKAWIVKDNLAAIGAKAAAGCPYWVSRSP